MRKQPRILVFAGSLRSGSLNQRLADAYSAELSGLDCEVTRITLADYPLPIMDEDLEAEKGLPEAATRLARKFAAHDGLVIVGPEYNGSITPLLKNAIDWTSRVRAVNGKPVSPFRNRLCAVASASDGAMGGYSSLTHLRHVLVRLGMLVISEQLALGNASGAFDDMGRIAHERSRGILASACKSLVEKASLLG